MKMTLGRLVIFVVVAWALVPLVLWKLGDGVAERGQFGDMFGVVNALFSGLAFAGLYWALHLQREQLELQRSELGLQREELRLQREEMAASRGELANQAQAQRDLARVTAAQIAVAGFQARIEALAQRAATLTPVHPLRQEVIDKISAHADALVALADRIERSVMGPAPTTPKTP